MSEQSKALQTTTQDTILQSVLRQFQDWILRSRSEVLPEMASLSTTGTHITCLELRRIYVDCGHSSKPAEQDRRPNCDSTPALFCLRAACASCSSTKSACGCNSQIYQYPCKPGDLSMGVVDTRRYRAYSIFPLELAPAKPSILPRHAGSKLLISELESLPLVTLTRYGNHFFSARHPPFRHTERQTR